ncbi:hypothetical protein FGO68_gene13007 [Halteria grandinella]|uniref:Serine hydrolase domain-containing protein n=1 Tax=Halteria grandinella TaxID=5974 RepID=A0A8J8NWM5_HALGN|nr:hypothetical protein FGO68_gene13007 [Halteria grandinella]
MAILFQVETTIVFSMILFVVLHELNALNMWKASQISQGSHSNQPNSQGTFKSQQYFKLANRSYLNYNKQSFQMLLKLDTLSVPQRKLKILCLHGLNNHIESFKFMSKGFTDQLSHIADFYYVEASFSISDVLPPEPGLLEKGFKPPFKSWFNPKSDEEKWVQDILKEYFKTAPPLPDEIEAQVCVQIEENLSIIENAIKADGPFDGVFAFSQGNAIFRLFCFMAQQLYPERYKSIQLPRFVISISGTVFLQYLFLIDGKLYGPLDCKVQNVDSIHIFGTKDIFYDDCLRETAVYIDSPDVMKVQIVHNKGHLIYSRFTECEQKQLANFMERQILHIQNKDKSVKL